MKKEFWEQYTIGEDHILTDKFTKERLGFFIDPQTNVVRFIPEYQYKHMIKRQSLMLRIWKRIIKSVKRVSRLNP